MTPEEMIAALQLAALELSVAMGCSATESVRDVTLRECLLYYAGRKASELASDAPPAPPDSDDGQDLAFDAAMRQMVTEVAD